ncbi:alpha/beta fold hydrolase [Pseudomonas rhodesiae]|uniref:alpha/beta fold hydrolase n=1 Tax=Pseudomonas rhodesiae TaxID=76760 RepID=UPI001F28366C|nr:hypothetical protein [Pseudomonas rhodesiae]
MQTERPEFWNEFSKTNGVTVPLIRGELSDLLTDDIAQRIAEINPAAIITIVADRGHPPLLNEPQSLSAIDALLKRADKWL